jgi:transposase
LDNAKYHKATLYNPDVHKMTKEEVKAYLRANDVQFIDSTVNDLKGQLRAHLSNKPCDVERIAAEAGHRVLWSPPYHSDLQPIELLWAYIKGRIGRKYNIKTTLKDVKRNLDQEFHDVRFEYSLIHSFIEKTAKTTKEMYDTADWDDYDAQLEEDPPVIAAAPQRRTTQSTALSTTTTSATPTNPVEQLQNSMPTVDTIGDITQYTAQV